MEPKRVVIEGHVIVRPKLWSPNEFGYVQVGQHEEDSLASRLLDALGLDDLEDVDLGDLRFTVEEV